MGQHFTCANCGKEFESAWSEEEAKTEAQQLWGEIPKEDKVKVCDNCFNQFMRAMDKLTAEQKDEMERRRQEYYKENGLN